MYRRIYQIVSALWLAALLSAFGAAHAAGSMAPGDAAIGMQAIATFKDSSNTALKVLSNKVETIVAKVYAVKLDDGTRVQGIYGQTVYIGHKVTNAGNTLDSFLLKMGALPAKVVSAKIYPDENGDLRPDAGSTGVDALAGFTTPTRVAGESYGFVIELKLAAESTTRDASTDVAITFAATSTNDATAKADGTSHMDVVRDAAFEFRADKTGISVNKGDEPEIKFVTKNLGGVPGVVAFKQVFESGDAADLSYVADSLKLNGAALANGATINGKPAFVNYDETTKTLTAAFSVKERQEFNVTFKTKVGSAAPDGAERKLAFEYGKGVEAENKPTGAIDGTPFKMRPFTVKVNDVSAVEIVATTIRVESALAHVPFYFDADIKNNGSRKDRIKLSVEHNVAGAKVELVNPYGFPLQDNNGDASTGELAPGASEKIRIKVTVTGTASKDLKFQLDAASGQYTGSTSKEFTLGEVKNIAVSIRKSGATDAQFTEVVDPAQPHFVKLTVKNTSLLAIEGGERYRLGATTTTGAASVTYRLPVGGACTAEGAAILQTDPLAKDAAQEICAQVSAIDQQSQVIVSFKATSQTDAEQSDTVTGTLNSSALPLAFNVSQQAGTVLPNGTVTYTYKLKNTGLLDLAANVLTLTKQSKPEEWPVRAYIDPNNTGSTDGAGVTQIGADGKINAALVSGAEVSILIVIEAPSTVLDGDKHNVTITVGKDGQSVTATSQTTVSRDKIAVKKTQALSSNCGVFEGLTPSDAKVSAKPGECVWYVVTVENTGSAAVTDLVVQDTFSEYAHLQNGTTVHADNAGTVIASGDITVTGSGVTVKFGTLDATKSATLRYKMQVNDGT